MNTKATHIVQFT